MKFNTSTMGFGLCVLGVILIAVQLFTGKGDFAQIMTTSASMIVGGIGLIKAADSENTVKKDELPAYGPVGQALSREGIKAEDAKEKLSDVPPAH